MSCTVSPVTSTSTAELQDLQASLRTIQAGVIKKAQSRAAASANMTYAPAPLPSAQMHRPTKLTLPLSLDVEAEKLEHSGNKLLYRLKPDQSFRLAPFLNVEYVSSTSTKSQMCFYSREVDEADKKIRYAVVAQLNKVKSLTAPELTPPTRPETVPLAPLDQEFNNSLSTQAVNTVSGTADTDSTVVLNFFKSTDGSDFTPHTVSTYGWDIPSSTTEEKLLLTKTPTVDESMSYPVNEARPFGNFFKTCRPPGFKKSWNRVATKDFSVAMMESEIPNGVRICASYKDITEQPNYEELESAIVNGSIVTLRHESGGLLYLPVNLFEIRPKVGSGVARVNVVDIGPFPRKTPKGKNIRQGYRPTGTKLYSAGGNYQYIQSTWETLAKRYSRIFGITKGIMWLWEAPPQAQAWYQAAYCTEFFHNYTRDVRDVFPPFYYAIMVHANNIGTSMSQKYLQAAAAAIEAERVNNPNYDRVAAHLTCKRVYEGKAWLILKHSAYMNRISAALQRELPLIDPIMYPNNPSLYPKAV